MVNTETKVCKWNVQDCDLGEVQALVAVRKNPVLYQIWRGQKFLHCCAHRNGIHFLVDVLTLLDKIRFLFLHVIS